MKIPDRNIFIFHSWHSFGGDEFKKNQCCKMETAIHFILFVVCFFFLPTLGTLTVFWLISNIAKYQVCFQCQYQSNMNWHFDGHYTFRKWGGLLVVSAPLVAFFHWIFEMPCDVTDESFGAFRMSIEFVDVDSQNRSTLTKWNRWTPARAASETNKSALAFAITFFYPRNDK